MRLLEESVGQEAFAWLTGASSACSMGVAVRRGVFLANRAFKERHTWSSGDLDAIINDSLTFKRPGPSPRGGADPALLCRTRD